MDLHSLTWLNLEELPKGSLDSAVATLNELALSVVPTRLNP